MSNIQHIFKGSGAPATTPIGVGHHYIDELGKKSYISVGISSSADWLLVGDPSTVQHAIVTNTGTIDEDIEIAIANPAAPITLTLPQIGLVLNGATTKPFTIRNISIYTVTINPFTGEFVEGDTAIDLMPGATWTLLPTSLGWYII